MSSYFFSGHHPHQPQQHQHQHPPPPTHIAQHTSHTHHGGRSRRAQKMGGQNSHRQFRGVKSMRELAEAPAITAFRARFEAGRSFDLDDDLEFCPGLLTEDDLQSIASSVSDRSSLASASPDSSPLQHQIQPTQQVAPAISLSPASINSYNSNSFNQMKIHQPSAVRTRNAIPIVNPSTGMRVSSPPSTISPGMMQSDQRRW
ncbi:uncharacterized protein CIMG_00297 [Coccidioides immitis RS]|uniref:Uncharacterized protein n=3 Tax=Coccidioides immitis TaxID=5501 RepID=J3KGQ0_COCIM|nr:uncharacterized protein CIMG_00297 [Coccidioides immitis RS]EAS34943.3 hypothetical protein CIMG_00297 [Coccidioides immitis RS]KMU81773.1 hypothetical protein CISG_02791 [Coccidioides immitis RMSCC 3703]KMU84317.1 hypothetical protein CIHG_02103 [Coccidioides immitis H538.4]